MSDLVFPSSLPSLDIKVEREVRYATTVHTSASGKEVRARWQTTPRYRYRLKFNGLRSNKAAPAPNQAYTETALVLKFLNDHQGAWDSFLYVDPYDGVQRRVRLVEDSLVFERVVSTWWAASVEFISVK